MTEPMLRARGLARTFGGLRAVDDLDLDLAHAEIHALIGPNGAGKSTLIGLLCGTITPDRGRVVLDGRDITRLSPAERAARGLARSFQVPRLAAPLSVRRNVMLPVAAARGSCFRFWRACRSDRVLQDETMRILARVGLERRADIAVGTLSHGERRLVEIACALALRPRVLLLDEPLAGLDPASGAGLAALLATLTEEVPILLVEHDMDAVFRLADRVTVLVRGRRIAQGPPAVIRADPAVREAYLGDEAPC